jgi:hypothetical protein
MDFNWCFSSSQLKLCVHISEIFFSMHAHMNELQKMQQKKKNQHVK